MDLFQSVLAFVLLVIWYAGAVLLSVIGFILQNWILSIVVAGFIAIIVIIRMRDAGGERT
ncbi:hypothetical protein JQ594_36025 [Bradyrhizobium manausense]|uniref:hypothetical protein n=1 Tax=Bradyrhizobium manausense TaxID=989370 RepID=UPI001BADDF78|nr:hypothetical protein [Bradyrhizobium manausense]MBR0691369.1 hypothetical protein [Bradyrhizobium manausense]MBR0725303.1 hypothetical protein [Bradyrhizobium manausense]